MFPHAGHVQMAIGNNLVVEAPTSAPRFGLARWAQVLRSGARCSGGLARRPMKTA
ncbi:secreted domain protein [Mycobacterium xenopi 4042]|uniref:Secreted domain protein n=1 Tax=Mycobacterium xenopi 4042 TaxID=1299334 RepID=X8CLH8_MYCXE|nr:secreted domain protein [Mycobacterium xenopi 4042]